MILRVARHTTNLNRIKDFYCNILNLEVLGGFENHSDYRGLFLGKPNAGWHLEFTISYEKPKHLFDDDDIIVFYPKTKIEYNNIASNIKKANIVLHKAKNPYWVSNGIMVKDPDGCFIVVSNLKIDS